MNPELPTNPREELELRLTALLLGELSEYEAANVREAIAKDPELAKLHDDLKHTIRLVRVAATRADEPAPTEATQPKLSDERRKKLLTAFAIPPLKKSDRKSKPSFQIRLIEALAVLALIALLASLAMPNFVKSRATSQSNAIINNLRQLDGAKQQWALEHGKSANDVPIMKDLSPYLKGVSPVMGETYVLGKVNDSPSAELKAGRGRRFYRLPSDNNLALNEVVTASPVATLATPLPKGGADTYSDNVVGYANLNRKNLFANPAPPAAGREVQVYLPSTELAPDAREVAGVQQQIENRLQSGRPNESGGVGGGVGGRNMKLDYGEFAAKGVGPAVNDPDLSRSTVEEKYPERVAREKRLPQVALSVPKGTGERLGQPQSQDQTISAGSVVISPPPTVAAAPSPAKPVAGHYDKLAEAKELPAPAPNGPGGGAVVENDSALGQAYTALPAPVLGDMQLFGRLSRRENGREVANKGSANAGESGIPSRLPSKGHELAFIPAPDAVSSLGTAEDRKVKSTDSYAYRLRVPLQQFEHQEQGEIILPKALPEAPDTSEALDVSGPEKLGRGYATERQAGVRTSSLRSPEGEIKKTQQYFDHKRELVQLETGAVVQLKLKDEDRAIRRPATNAPIPQPEIQTSDNAFSTFSLNVSDVSFKLAAASLEKGQMPEPASVRSEEFINAFDYRDPEPPAGVPIAFAWERAWDPFAHNRDLLRFSLKTAATGRQAGRPLNIVLLLDNSGSMERADRVRIIREALRVLASQLQPQDKLSVITFARTPRLFADGVSGDKAGEVTEQVCGLTPQGGTNLEDAMHLAYQTALRHYLANGINRVVLLTDGAANLGNVEPESLKQKVETYRKQGIALDCFGIGWEGYNDDLLEVLSSNGDGRYGFINSPEEAATEFAGQLAGALKVAASDVKVQVEFNPRRVTAYRQIGYAKHQLTKEQFRDNTVDAAEIAAQEAGNALYTVEVNPSGEGPLCTVRVRYKTPGTTDYREQAWDVPYTGNAVSLEQSSPAMCLAATASAFSEWLVASPFAAEVTPDRLLGYLSGVPEVYGADARPKKLEWMIRQAKSIGGK